LFSGIVKEFMYFCHNTNGRCVDIIGLTADYLNMPIFIEEFANPETGRNGYYSDGEQQLEIVRDGHIQSVTFPKNSMVLDKRLVYSNRDVMCLCPVCRDAYRHRGYRLVNVHGTKAICDLCNYRQGFDYAVVGLLTR
jgi:hypothetical protein